MPTLIRIFGAPVLTGIAAALCFPTLHLYPLAWVALVPLLYQTAWSAPRAAALQFFVSGWVFHSIVLQWLVANIYWAGGWAILGQQGLCVTLSLYWAAAGYAWAALRRRNHAVAGALCFAALWLVMEWLQAWLFTGFGWCALGYTQGADERVRQWAAIFGVHGISFLLVLANALLALGLAEAMRRRMRLAAAVLVVAGAQLTGVLLPGFTVRQYEPFRAGIYQSNYAQQMKWDWEFREDMVRRAAEQSESLSRFAGPVDLFVWPEALVMDHGEQPDLMRYMAALTQSTGAPLFTGTERHTREGVYNSSMLVDTEGEIRAWYDKVHLAPFGEYVPFDQFLPFLNSIVPGGSLEAGTDQRLVGVGEKNFGPLICFEVLFGPMAEWYRAKGADFLVVITNLGWFGMSNAAAQELEIARMRAIETRLPVIHCSNTGISGVFDPLGGFEPVDGMLSQTGHYFQWPSETLEPASLLLARRMGVLTVPMYPVARLLHGARVFPWLGLAVVLGFAAWAALKPGAPSAAPKPDETAQADVMI